MSNNRSNTASKSSFSSKNTKASLPLSCKAYKSVQRKVIPSRKLGTNCNETKSCQSNVASVKKYQTKTKNTSASEATVTTKCQKNTIDYCKRCGDVVEKNTQKEAEIGKIVNAMNAKCVRNDNIVNMKKNTSQPVQQYYKNKNFLLSNESRKNSLDTIKEVSELHAISDDSLFLIYSDSDDDVTYLDPDDDVNIEKLKQFRKKNYFECHSAKSRIKTRGSVTSLNDHKCVYRFYLNDRLFPVPLNTDYNNKVRCVECQLPMDIKNDAKDGKINGTIQAKVKLGNETQDMVLLLPVKDSLIMKERRREEGSEVDDKYVYFGVVKLGTDGNSLFSRTSPHNSLALKYQKGYKELANDGRYTYKSTHENDIVII